MLAQGVPLKVISELLGHSAYAIQHGIVHDQPLRGPAAVHGHLRGGRHALLTSRAIAKGRHGTSSASGFAHHFAHQFQTTRRTGRNWRTNACPLSSPNAMDVT